MHPSPVSTSNLSLDTNTRRFPLNTPAYHARQNWNEPPGERIQYFSNSPPERIERMEMCQIIRNVGHQLRFPYYTLATAEQLFMKFFASNSSSNYRDLALEIAQTCLFLSSKIEETMKKFREIIVETGLMQNPTAPHGWDIENQSTAMEVERIKNQLLTHERVLLETIGFDFRTYQPQRYVVKVVKRLEGLKWVEGDSAPALAKSAWSICIDVLATSVVIRYSQFRIAIACILLATLETRIVIMEPDWMTHFPLSNGLVESGNAAKSMVYVAAREIVDAYVGMGSKFQVVERYERLKHKLAEKMN